MDIFSYHDGSFMVAGDTLLMYSGKSAEPVTIPAEASPGHPIRVIGSGAFAHDSILHSVTIPDGVTSIGERAFYGCKALSSVTIPDSVTSIGERAFDGCEHLQTIHCPFSQENDILPLGNCLTDVNGNCIVLEPQRIEFLRRLPKDLFSAPSFVPTNVSVLFCDQTSPDQDDSGSACNVCEHTDAVCFDSTLVQHTEDEAFRQLLITGCFESDQPEAEAYNDWFLKTRNKPEIEKTCLVKYCPAETGAGKRGNRAELHLRRGYWFWPSAQRIAWKNKMYYLYSRNYLTGSNDVPYYRLAMAIYDGNGLVNDQGILEEVYAKYKLSAIL